MKVSVEVKAVFLKKEICTSVIDGVVKEFANYYVMYEFDDKNVLKRISESEYEKLKGELK